jgi:hypothetical protein
MTDTEKKAHMERMLKHLELQQTPRPPKTPAQLAAQALKRERYWRKIAGL